MSHRTIAPHRCHPAVLPPRWSRHLTPIVCLSLLAAAGAVRAADYVVQATVADIDGRPVAGVQVAVGPIRKEPLKTKLETGETGSTDAAGQVALKLSTGASPVGAMITDQDPGRVHLPADPIVRLAKGTNRVQFQLLTLPDTTKMAAGGTAATRGFFGATGKAAYPSLETKSFDLDDSPLHLWRAYGGQPGKPVLVVQGLFLTTEHPTPMQVFEQAFDLIQGLRHAGRDVWVLAFSDALAPIAAQALAVSEAVRTASEAANGAKVDVVGLSLGGLAARYALARDEANNGPSAGKAGVFATVDAPHQGANIHVALQAAIWVASGNRENPGGNTASRLITAPGVQNILYQWIGGTNFDQNTCEFPLNRSITTTSAAHDAFSAELATLNGDGYPHRTRNIAVAASAPAPRPQKVGDVVYRLKASAGVLIGRITLCQEDYKARPEDVLPGSTFPGGLLPDHVELSDFTIDLTRKFDPTFVPYASALDLKGSTSPFAATFAAKQGQLVHGAFPDGTVPFLLKELTAGGA